jgi:leucyl aminopeptidase
MIFTQTKKAEAGVAMLFFLSGKEDLPNHPLLELLAEEDRKLLRSFAEKSEIKEASIHSVFLPSGRRVLVIGKAKDAKFTNRKAILAMRQAVSVSKRESFETIQVSVDDFVSVDGGKIAEVTEQMATQFEMANFDFVKYRTAPKGGWKFVQKVFVVSGSSASLSEFLSRGKIVGEEVNASRDLSNTPGSDMTPSHLAAVAVSEGKKHGFKVRVLQVADMKKLGMGGILGVGQGSSTPPKFIIMEYLKGKKGQKPVVLAGKGITFDSGGLNLKPSDHIYEMHMDMSGGAAVIHTVSALARLKAKVNVVALVPAAENMISGNSYRPGDVLTTITGKTIEVMNTDAEGRVVLADTLGYSLRYKPRLVIDVATLTGAAMVALGQRASALFATDRKVEDRLREIGEATGDPVWPLPLWEEYEGDVKGTFGDVANSSKTRYGGAINGAMFLWQFIKDQSWVHLDIAPRMTAVEGEHLAKGAAGASVNLLVRFLESF